MASVIISGDTSGSVTLSAPATAGSNTIVLPSGSGTLTLPTGTATLTANGLNSNIVSGTAQASTSGTSIDFTGIPSWAKRITVMFNGMSTNGSSIKQIQIGSGSIITSGYLTCSQQGTATSAISTGFGISSSSAADIHHGQLIINNFGNNLWVASGNVALSGLGISFSVAGTSPILSGALDRVRITTVNGTDTFDAGSINILYE